MSAAAASRGLVEKFRAETHYFNTYASSPLQAAAGNAVLDVLENEDICKHVAEVGTWLGERLRDVQQSYPVIGDVRGDGLFFGLEWVVDGQHKTPDLAGCVRVTNALKEKGYLVSNAGAYDNVLKLRPPLVFSQADGEGFLAALEATLEELYG